MLISMCKTKLVLSAVLIGKLLETLLKWNFHELFILAVFTYIAWIVVIISK